MRVKQKLLSCVDCVIYAVYGEIPENRPGIKDEIRAHLGGDTVRLYYGDDDQQDPFSWEPCECCGSPLGGSRHELVILAE